MLQLVQQIIHKVLLLGMLPCFTHQISLNDNLALSPRQAAHAAAVPCAGHPWCGGAAAPHGGLHSSGAPGHRVGQRNDVGTG